ncbi:MAG: type II toxin-antitoxin system PemK/MazF family toxin [Campylobacterota bacterium]|nr:type II toxin-antitoxin system PemK/MazF family toxin [Campylobacterota bacterium]
MNIEQGEIWLVNFNPSVGNEIQKTRPCVVINDNKLGRFGLKIVVPITQYKEHLSNYPWILKIENNAKNGLSKESAFECFQTKSFSVKRFIKKIGYIEKEDILEIHKTVAKTLDPKYKLI